MDKLINLVPKNILFVISNEVG